MQAVFQISILVKDYDQALAFYVDTLGFALLEDTYISEAKRWVVVSPGKGAAIVLAKADDKSQVEAIGRQCGGRVGFFLGTDNFERDYDRYTSLGVKFVREPLTSDYGTVAVFEDLYGNQWDLIEHVPGHRFALTADD